METPLILQVMTVVAARVRLKLVVTSVPAVNFNVPVPYRTVVRVTVPAVLISTLSLKNPVVALAVLNVPVPFITTAVVPLTLPPAIGEVTDPLHVRVLPLSVATVVTELPIVTVPTAVQLSTSVAVPPVVIKFSAFGHVFPLDVMLPDKRVRAAAPAMPIFAPSVVAPDTVSALVNVMVPV
jgi:hypothetical protein